MFGWLILLSVQTFSVAFFLLLFDSVIRVDNWFTFLRAILLFPLKQSQVYMRTMFKNYHCILACKDLNRDSFSFSLCIVIIGMLEKSGIPRT